MLGQTEKLVSTLVNEDPDMVDIVLDFVNELPGRAKELERAFAARDWGKLEKLSHQLKGAGGSYGYPQITEVAATMEADCKSRSPNRFPASIEQFRRLIAAAEAALA